MPKWVHYLTRPMSLLESSLWNQWYNSHYAKTVLGVTMPDVLFIEYPQNNSYHFRKPEQLTCYLEGIQKIVVNDPEKIEKILLNGLELIDQAKKMIVSPSEMTDFEESVEFLTRLGLQTANIPRVALNAVEKYHLDRPELLELAEKIRVQTVYPEFTQKVLIPLVIKILENTDIQNPQKAIELLTFEEILIKDFQQLEYRLSERKKQKNYILQINNGVKEVKFSSNNQQLLRELLNVPSGKQQITGSIAYQGKAMGKVRVILNATAQNFEKGDILVSVSSSPELMPFILKSSAIVTDEGGLGCHAAVISRELKKPCIIGTKIATQILKDGDLVEVDATSGVVKIIG